MSAERSLAREEMARKEHFAATGRLYTLFEDIVTQRPEYKASSEKLQDDITQGRILGMMNPPVIDFTIGDSNYSARRNFIDFDGKEYKKWLLIEISGHIRKESLITFFPDEQNPAIQFTETDLRNSSRTRKREQNNQSAKRSIQKMLFKLQKS